MIPLNSRTNACLNEYLGEELQTLLLGDCQNFLFFLHSNHLEKIMRKEDQGFSFLPMGVFCQIYSRLDYCTEATHFPFHWYSNLRGGVPDNSLADKPHYTHNTLVQTAYFP
jgi:hypothetical protein